MHKCNRYKLYVTKNIPQVEEFSHKVACCIFCMPSHGAQVSTSYDQGCNLSVCPLWTRAWPHLSYTWSNYLAITPDTRICPWPSQLRIKVIRFSPVASGGLRSHIDLLGDHDWSISGVVHASQWNWSLDIMYISKLYIGITTNIL